MTITQITTKAMITTNNSDNNNNNNDNHTDNNIDNNKQQ